MQPMDGADYSVARAVTDSAVVVARPQRSILASASLVAQARVSLERSASLLLVDAAGAPGRGYMGQVADWPSGF